MMDYVKLILGIGLIAAFTWILVKNSKRSGFLHALIRIDTVVGMVAGIYLVFTSVQSLLFQV
jgi:hypothetical protein